VGSVHVHVPGACPLSCSRDAYDRLLRYVELRGRDIGRKQVRKGWAKPYVFESPFLACAAIGGRATKPVRATGESGPAAAATFISPCDASRRGLGCSR
jgi:endonuclease YncB( thermonuclease family)